MVLEIKRKDRETIPSLLHRFKKALKQSRVLIHVKERRFMIGPPSEKAEKVAALRKEELKKYYAKLKKLGQLEEKR